MTETTKILEENYLTETNKPTQGCKSCKKGLQNTHIGILCLSLYMFATSVYGTIKLIQLFF
jgi:hypothetical protein